MNVLSTITQNIVTSATSGMAARAQELKDHGINIISLSQGEPYIDTPKDICDFAVEAIHSGKYFKYPPTSGYSDLKEAIAHKYSSINNVPYETKNVVVTSGAKQAISYSLLSIINPEDEVIIIAPYWVSYSAQVKIAGGKPVVVNTELVNNFQFDVEEVASAITSNTKAILFSSPSNPTGIVYSQSKLLSLVSLLKDYPSIHVIADEIYEEINYNKEVVSIASFPEMFNRTITINGFSKSYGMTGWRVGYLCAPAYIAKEVSKIQGHMSSACCSFSQRAAIAALGTKSEAIKSMVKHYQARRDLVYDHLSAMPLIKTVKPEGAFYIFPDISNLYNRSISNSTQFANYILEEANVAIVPGAAFGEDKCVRISYGVSMKNLKEAMKRIANAIEKLEPLNLKKA